MIGCSPPLPNPSKKIPPSLPSWCASPLCSAALLVWIPDRLNPTGIGSKYQTLFAYNTILLIANFPPSLSLSFSLPLLSCTQRHVIYSWHITSYRYCSFFGVFKRNAWCGVNCNDRKYPLFLRNCNANACNSPIRPIHLFANVLYYSHIRLLTLQPMASSAPLCDNEIIV